MDEDEVRQATQHRLDLLEAMVKAQGDLPGLVALVMNSADPATAEAAVAKHVGVNAGQRSGLGVSART